MTPVPGAPCCASVRLGPAPSGVTAAIARMPDREEALVARRLSELAEGMRVTLEGIGRLAEETRQQAGGPPRP